MTITKRALVSHIGRKTGHTQDMVYAVLQNTLDCITKALARGDKVELRHFGVFAVKVRKASVGRDLSKPGVTVHIPTRATVKFKAGKEMRARVLKLSPAV